MIDISKNNVTLAEALKEAKQYDVIYLGKRIFREKIKINIPNLTLLGDGAQIIFNASHGTIIPQELGGDGVKTFGTTGSATFTVKKEATYFKAEGISFINDFKRNGCKNGQAVAFKSETSNICLNNCEFVSEQDTLYIDEGENNLIANCIIYGDVDFVFGSAECFFVNCQLIAINKGYFLAPDTYTIYKQGFVFKNCHFKVKGSYQIYLGRPWYPGGAKYAVYPQAKLIDCVLDEKINIEFVKMHLADPDAYQVKIINSKWGTKILNCDLVKK